MDFNIIYSDIGPRDIYQYKNDQYWPTINYFDSKHNLSQKYIYHEWLLVMI